jgi:hypothetical protein
MLPHLARRSDEYGIILDGAIRVDMRRVKARATPSSPAHAPVSRSVCAI